MRESVRSAGGTSTRGRRGGRRREGRSAPPRRSATRAPAARPAGSPGSAARTARRTRDCPPRRRPAPARPGGTYVEGTVNGSAAPITLDGVGKTYPDGTVAVDALSLDIAAGELVVLIGPSGCGKSTVLRMINRLIEPSHGRILLGDDDVTRVGVVELRRRIGYVFQHTGLFPHQTI